MNKNTKIIYLFLSIAGMGLFFALSAPCVSAYGYDFYVRSMETNVFVMSDGSITINYEIDFENGPYSSAIDVVDIGFPSKDYDLDSVSASIDGAPLFSIDESTVIDIGVEIWLYGNYIYAGESAHLSVNGTNQKMLYQDYENRSMASLEFSPTWFDSYYCEKYDYLEVNIWFPTTVNTSAEGITKWHHPEHGDPIVLWEEDPLNRVSEDIMLFRWTKNNADMKQYTFGVSFPGDALDEDALISWSANPALVQKVVNILLIISGIGLGIGIIYFIVRYFKVTRKRYYPPKKRTSSPTDYCCCGVFAAFFFGILILTSWYEMGDVYSAVGFFVIVIGGFAMLGYLLYRLIRRIRPPYSKPELLVDCAGVKKGLSVVEAAIIRNTPLNKVVFLIIYGLMKSGHLKIKDVEPLKFEITSTENLSSMKWYHRRFIDVINPIGVGNPINEDKLRKLLIELIKKTHTRMKGYNLQATVTYYENQVNRAWESVKKLPEGDIDWKDIENEYEWLMIDDLFEERSEKYFAHRYYRTNPYWYNRYYYYPYYHHRGHYSRYYPGHQTGNTVSGPARVSPNAPIERLNIHSLSDSLVRGMENMSNKLVNNFSTFADKIVDKVRPVVRPQSTGGGGGRSYSGGGCACACACAGCACACAGGGR